MAESRLREASTTVLGGKRDSRTHDRKVYHVTQEYSKYKLFSVRTEEEIQKLLQTE